MSQLKRIGYTLVGIIFMIPLLSAMFNFFDISVAIYLPYLVWAVALAIFYALLPTSVGSMFQAV